MPTTRTSKCRTCSRRTPRNGPSPSTWTTSERARPDHPTGSPRVAPVRTQVSLRRERRLTTHAPPRRLLAQRQAPDRLREHAESERSKVAELLRDDRGIEHDHLTGIVTCRRCGGVVPLPGVRTHLRSINGVLNHLEVEMVTDDVLLEAQRRQDGGGRMSWPAMCTHARPLRRHRPHQVSRADNRHEGERAGKTSHVLPGIPRLTKTPGSPSEP